MILQICVWPSRTGKFIDILAKLKLPSSRKLPFAIPYREKSNPHTAAYHGILSADQGKVKNPVISINPLIPQVFFSEIYVGKY